jgi:hypothetical protein
MAATPRYKVLLLRVCLTVEIERTASAVGTIINAVKRWCKPAMHSKRAVAFVILTEETTEELIGRLRPTLESISSVENYWCHTVLDDVVGRHGGLDPLRTYVLEAWEELRKRNKPNYVRKPERTETIIVGNMENFDRRTAIQMGIKARRPWKTTQKPDGPKSDV